MSGGVADLVRMMNYKLVLTEEHSEPYIFYKDEGKNDSKEMISFVEFRGLLGS